MALRATKANEDYRLHRAKSLSYYTTSNSSQAAKVSRGGAGTPACRVDTLVDACSEFDCGSAAPWDRPSFFVACLLPQASSTERSHGAGFASHGSR